jgi:TRAP-type mannitol/chloroaromatic compound transport system permease small subunit
MDAANPAVATKADFLSRLFSWGMLAFLLAYLISNTLVHGAAWPGVAKAFSADGGWRSWAQILIYGAALALAWVYVNNRPHSMRADAASITAINTYLIRSLFWAVLFIGLADMAISFLRVEGLLPQVAGEQLAKDLGRPLYRGPYVHVPLLCLGFVFGAFTKTLGFHWLAVLIVIAELAIVITRFIFSYEQAFMGDLVRFWYAALFLFASAYTLLQEGHVRVDVFYSNMKERSKGFVNAFGAIAFGITLCWTILVIGLSGKSSIIYGPLTSFEVSQSGFGMYTKYLMAGFLGVFAITMLLQFIAQFLESCADYRRLPGARKIATEIAH